MASPAEIANDLAQLAKLRVKQDRWVSDTCVMAVKVIRSLDAGQPLDGRTLRACQDRLWRAEERSRDHTVLNSLGRARDCIAILVRETRR